MGSVAFAQSDPRLFTVYVGGGPTMSTAHVANYLKHGFNLTAGAGIRAHRAVEFLGEFQFHNTGVQEGVLTSLRVPDGSARLYNITGNVKLNLVPAGAFPDRFNLYAIAGGGWYRRTVEFTEPTTSSVAVIDPWWGYVGNVLVPASNVLGSVSRNAGGINAGGGLEFGVGERSKVFAEARWHRAYHNPTNTTIIPVTIGLRF